MTTVCIIGAGDLGGATAQALASFDAASRILFIDPAANLARGKALDLQQACTMTGSHTRLDGTDDWSRLTGCAAAIIAAPAGGSADTWSDDHARALVSRLADYAGAAPLIFAGASHGPLLLRCAQDGSIAPDRLLGSAPQAVISAMTALVAMEARCAPAEVLFTLLGAPGRLVVPWSEASIGGRALERVLSPPQIARLDARCAQLWPPEPGALGRAAALVTSWTLSGSRRMPSLFAVLQGEFGIRDRVGIVPTRLWPGGLLRVEVPPLNTREQVLLETALGT